MLIKLILASDICGSKMPYFKELLGNHPKKPYLDTTAEAVGDLYYILNLVATIEVPRP